MRNLTPHQYKPFNHRANDVPLIIYPVKSDDNSVKNIVKDSAHILRKLDELYAKYSEELQIGIYHIVFIWGWGGYFMTDIWIYRQAFFSDEYGDTSLDFCKTYKDLEPHQAAGLASQNTIVTLGREQEHRWKFDSVEEYVDRSKSIPDFPTGFTPSEEF